MNLHEYRSKELFAQYAIPVPQGQVAAFPEEAVAAAQRLGGSLWVVKAQVHAGGRLEGAKEGRPKSAEACCEDSSSAQRTTLKVGD
jgi:succinyl-CoA synthetase beta subunit